MYGNWYVYCDSGLRDSNDYWDICDHYKYRDSVMISVIVVTVVYCDSCDKGDNTDYNVKVVITVSTDHCDTSDYRDNGDYCASGDYCDDGDYCGSIVTTTNTEYAYVYCKSKVFITLCDLNY